MRTAWPTVASGDTWTAADFNTYCRNNDRAYWIFTTRGDLAYATSASALARLAISANAGALLNAGASAPAWTLPKRTQYQTGTADGAYEDASSTASGGWSDVPNATKTLVLAVTSTIVVLATLKGYASGGGSFFDVRAVVNGVADAAPSQARNNYEFRNENLFYCYMETGVPSGNRIVKLQSHNSNNIEGFRFVAWSIAE